jgi:hypothetical protein
MNPNHGTQSLLERPGFDNRGPRSVGFGQNRIDTRTAGSCKGKQTKPAQRSLKKIPEDLKRSHLF